jgi:uncharacterized membrane protein
MTWVNSSWGGFSTFQPWHLGIIACIGISMIFLTLIVNWRWEFRLLTAVSILLIHPFLLTIHYNPENTWVSILMETFIQSGSFNKYPVLPWFALAILGSVMTTGWLQLWKTAEKRILISLGIAASIFLLAIVIRLARGYGNISPFSEFGSWSFLLDQKYPPSLFMGLWSFAAVVAVVSLFIFIGKVAPKLLMFLTIPGKVPLFFYAVHLAILGIFIKRLDFFYREGGVLETLIGLTVMLVIMLPLCNWFYGVKRRSTNYFIRMM